MVSSILWITSIVSFIGFVINIIVMLVVLSRGKKIYHLLFAFLLLIGAFWDLGIFLIMIRNSFHNEIIRYQNLITIPFMFLPAFFFHFTTSYLNQPHKKITIVLYCCGIFGLSLLVTGMHNPVIGVYDYGWGAVARYELGFLNLSWIPLTYLSIFFSCLLLFQARKREISPLIRRHIGYILISFIVFSIAHLKILLVYGVNAPYILPLGMLLIDSFGAIIGIAIVKDRLFDITVFVRKGIVYSILAALIIFIFDFSQHLIAKYLGDILGGHSIYIHFAIIAVVVGLFMPLKPKLEHIVSSAFARKKIKF